MGLLFNAGFLVCLVLAGYVHQYYSRRRNYYETRAELSTFADDYGPRWRYTLLVDDVFPGHDDATREAALREIAENPDFEGSLAEAHEERDDDDLPDADRSWYDTLYAIAGMLNPFY